MGEKVRRLIDEHIIIGIDVKIPPVEITADDFDEKVAKERSPRAAASEMEHALRHHIRKHLDEDPTHYEKLSERLKGILQEFEGRWEEMVESLATLVQEAKQGRQKDDVTGLDPKTQAPFFDVLKHEAVGKGKLEGKALERMCVITVELVAHIRQEIGIVDFWTKPQAQESLQKWIFRALDDSNLLPFKRLNAVADKLMELAKANHYRLVP